MADNDDSKQPSKKISIGDLMAAIPGTAPELKDADDEPKVEPKEAKPAAQDKDADESSDPETDKAVDDIMKNDSDEVLKAQDEAAENAAPTKLGRMAKFKNFWASWWASPKKRWTTIAVATVVIVAPFVLPTTRYNVLGVALSADVSIHTVDSKSGKPVSGVTVEIAGKKAETNAEGVAVLHVHTGTRQVTVSKKYYTGDTESKLVTLSAAGNTFKTSLVATGRQVNIKLVNKITGKPVVGATMSSSGSTAKTNADGLATMVIASGSTSQDATVSLSGYNTTKVTITADGTLAKNTFTVTPSGKIYFLSNLSGTVDVVKANLDGTERKVVLEGTGKEDKSATSLLASRDWKYLALLAKRTSDQASVYLIDTTNGDLLTTIDEGDANFKLLGWSGDTFIYTTDRNSVQLWQANKHAIKSFDPTTGHTLLLDQTQGSGAGGNDYASQFYSNEYLIGDQVVYAKSWAAFSPDGLVGKQGTFDTIGADGSGHKVLKSFPFPYGASSFPYYMTISVNPRPYELNGIYIEVDYNGDGRTYYTYEDGKVTDNTDLTDDQYYQAAYPTYLLSPSGNGTFWSDQRDGKNMLFTGDKIGKNQKQVGSLTEYNTYGWFTDDYLLVSKSSSELYIMPASGGTPLKVTDYYKPAINYNSYGGGYGGL